ncbi:MAG: PD-(D/E)XK nuclease family protein [Dehalococcoidia bacterium]|nr:PD-(D/E)XK nuclease family protein [Dehalococcoidia bacterium]
MAGIASQDSTSLWLTEAPARVGRRPVASPLRLSPTAVTCFRQCPRQYKFRYIDRLGDEYGGPRPYFTMGNHVHDTLREFLTTVPLDERNMETMVRLLRKNWRRYRVGFRGQEDERRWAEKALRQLSSFVTSHDIRIRPYLVEAWFETEITPGLVLHGRIDRVDLQADRTLHIIDYKTGNTPEASDWTQLYLNALALSRKMPYPVSKASFIYLSSGLMDTASIESNVLDRARWDLLLTARSICCDKNFRSQPGIICRRCDFKPICPDRVKLQKVEATEVQQGDRGVCHGMQRVLVL